MIYYKSPKEIAIMQKGGKILSDVLHEVVSHAKPGVSELELDKLAEELIKKRGGEPGFKKIDGYSHAICVSTNEVVVHGVPTNYKLKVGDVIGIDCGVYLEGFNTDMSETIKVESGKLKVESLEDEIDIFLKTGKKALEETIKVAKLGNRVGHISEKIQEIVEGQGYSVVRSLIGHGVGKKLHEDPEVPGYLETSLQKTPLLKNGMTLAIEVIYNMGGPNVVYAGRDNWTIQTEDGSISGVFERTVAITKNGTILLTP